jgi:hypothetical protein
VETKTKQKQMFPFGLEETLYEETPPFLLISQELDNIPKRIE